MTDLASTLGVALLGCLAAAILYGLTSVQRLLYFQGKVKDGWAFRCGILTLWVLDTISIILTAHAIYFYLIINFGNYQALQAPIWSLLIEVYVTNLSDIIVRGYFAKRVSFRTAYTSLQAVAATNLAVLIKVCGHRRPFLRLFLPILIAVLSLITFIFGASFASRAFQLESFAAIDHAAAIYLYISFPAAVAADFIVATSLCAVLFQSRTGIKRTDSILKILIAFIINTGLLTSLCALACLVTYAIWPKKFIFIGFYFVLSKLYVNSLLASLNARSSLRERGMPSDTNGRGLAQSAHTTLQPISVLQFAGKSQSVEWSFGTTTNDTIAPQDAPPMRNEAHESTDRNVTV